jgi:hypothetical protein
MYQHGSWRALSVVNISRMVQLALGVVDAVPAERRAHLAEERLVYMSSEHRFARRPETHSDVLSEAAAEIIGSIERLYYEGRLDYTLCGLAVANRAADPIALIEKIATPIALDIGPNNYNALAQTCLKALVDWVQAYPNLDGDQSSTAGLSWENRTDAGRSSESDVSPPARAGWRTRG